MVADVLSRRVMILGAMSTGVTWFERLREDDFGEIYIMLRDEPTREMDGFLLHNGYLFRFHIYIPRTSLRDFLS